MTPPDSAPVWADKPYSIKRYGVSLSDCDSEPVHTPGCIQSHGVLLALASDDLCIVQVSENVERWLGHGVDALLGAHIAKVLGEAGSRRLQEALATEPIKRNPLHLMTVPFARQGLNLDVTVHTMDDVVLVEFEPGSRQFTSSDLDFYKLYKTSVGRIQASTSLQSFAQTVCDEIRGVTNLDRVMLYRFHEDKHGEVFAEAKREDLSPFLGLHYPAEDIPEPAREIFKRLWIRPVPDVRSELVEMVPLANPRTGKPLNMTYCALRGPSTMYTEYLENMDVRAALTMPIRNHGELWGLVACHQYSGPLEMPYRLRAACEFYAQVASNLYETTELKEHVAYRDKINSLHERLFSQAAATGDLSTITQGSPSLLDGIRAHGVAVFFHNQWHCAGSTPTLEQLDALTAWLHERPELALAQQPVYATRNLPADFPEARAYADIAAGVLAVPLARAHKAFVMWFRPETIQTLKWAGSPDKPATVPGPHGPRLTPRRSFELFVESVHLKADPWNIAEIDAAKRLRLLLLDTVIADAERLTVINQSLVKSTAASGAYLREQFDRANAAEASLDISRDWLQLIADNVPAMIAYWDDKRVCRFANSAWRDGLQMDPQTMIGRSLQQVLGEVTCAQNRLAIDQALQGKAATFDYVMERPEGRKSFIQVSLRPHYRYGKMAGLFSLMVDVTSLREAEELSNHARAVAEAAVAAKSQFLANMSHEIRTPLNGIIGMSEILAETALDDEQRRFLQIVHNCGKHLMSLINDILDLSKMEAGKLETQRERFDLGQLLHSVDGMFSVSVRAKGLLLETELDADLPTAVVGDAGRLRQVLVNLIGNAVKFTREGHVKVRARLQERSKQRLVVRFSVEDTGIGVDPLLASRLFDPFTQADGDTSRHFGGTGLGLSISKQLVELMGGHIGLEAGPGAGSLFWFTTTLQMPDKDEVLAEAPAFDIAPELQATGDPTRDLNVLVVDDNEVNQLVVVKLLQKLGHTATVADSGIAALSALAQKPYDLVFMDCQMPGMDGFEATRIIRAQEAEHDRHVPVIALTANAMREDAARCMSAGMDDHLSKPVTRRALAHMLERWVPASSAGQQ